MARYALALAPTAVGAGLAAFDIATAATDRVSVLEIGVFVQTAVALDVSIARTTAVGTRTTPTTMAAEGPDPAGTASMATAWSVAPTISATDLRRAMLPGNIGAGIIWTWAPGQFYIPVSSSIVVVNRGALGPALRVYAVVEE